MTTQLTAPLAREVAREVMSLRDVPSDCYDTILSEVEDAAFDGARSVANADEQTQRTHAGRAAVLKLDAMLGPDGMLAPGTDEDD